MSHRPDLEEDYEAIHKDGYRDDPYENTVLPVGLCQHMCSDEEMQEREQNGRLNKYEIVADSNPPRVDFNLAIKEFKRSCVGREFTLVGNLRPWSVLRRTLHHLLLDICFKEDDWMYICDFVFDRLKAVRQDMIIQRIEGRRYIEILEGSIRFLVYSMYRLTCTLKDYSKNQPIEPIVSAKGPVSGLNNYEMHVVREMKLTMQCLRDCLNSLIVQYQENVPDSPYRPLFEAIHLIVNLPFLHGHHVTSTEFQSKSELRNSDPMFKLVFKMYREHLSGNHRTALKHLPCLIEYPLIILAYAPAIAQLQIHMVQLFRKAYSATGANTSSVRYLSNLICPKWLDVDRDECLLFAKFIAIQFGFYDDKRHLCDYKLDKRRERLIPRDFIEKARIERMLAERENEGDNETRHYALQLIAGKDWSFYQEVLKVYGVTTVLDPTQPPS